MLSFGGAAPIYLYAGVADMRKSFDGLLGLIEQAGMADAEQRCRARGSCFAIVATIG